MSETLEHELRALVADCRDAARPVRPDLEGVARRARGQRRRHQVVLLTGVGALALVAALAAGVLGGTTPTSVGTGGTAPAGSAPTTAAPAVTEAPPATPESTAPVPSTPTTAAVHPTTTVAAGGPDPTDPAEPAGPDADCTRAGLATGYDDQGGSGMNQHYATVILTNRSGAPCLLPIGLRVELLAGDRVVTTAAPRTAAAPPITLDPGAEASFVVHSVNPEVACPGEPATEADRLRITLSPTLQLVMPTPVRAVICDSGVYPPDIVSPLVPGR